MRYSDHIGAALSRASPFYIWSSLCLPLCISLVFLIMSKQNLHVAAQPWLWITVSPRDQVWNKQQEQHSKNMKTDDHMSHDNKK